MQSKPILIPILILVVYLTGMLVDVMAVDAAQYAEMSLEMLRSGSYLKIFCLGKDYLDKPPLIFWLSSASLYLFGVSSFSYKLPSVLFALLGIYSTYRFTALYYSRQTAVRAALMLATTQALFLITNDVRTDTLLMGSVIFAIWRCAAYMEQRRSPDLLWGCAGIGLALLAKGPVGLIAVGAAIMPQALIRGQWKAFLRPVILVGLGIIALLLLPMCIGLYQQHGMAGLRFYFWTQSFGRITGDSDWNNHPDAFFLLHTTAWAFMPWTIFLLGGWLTSLTSIMRDRVAMKEYISVAGFTLMLLSLMLSRYQLPHYSFIVYPLGAVMAADYYERLSVYPRIRRAITILQVVLLIAIVVVAGLLQYAFKADDMISLISLIIAFISVAIAAFMTRDIFRISIAVILAFNFLMNAFYFPAILRYQPGGDFGRYVSGHKDMQNEFVTYQYLAGYEDIFYSSLPPPEAIWDHERLMTKLHNRGHLMIAASAHGLDDIRKGGIPFTIIQQRLSYKVSNLTPAFLSPGTRESVCEKVYLLEMDE